MKTTKIDGNTAMNKVYIVDKIEGIPADAFSGEELDYINTRKEDHKADLVEINRFKEYQYVYFVDAEKADSDRWEACRRAGDKLAATLNGYKQKEITIVQTSGLEIETITFVEGLALGNYQFLKYLSKPEDKKHSLETIGIQSESINDELINILNINVDSVCFARDLINEPVAFLNAPRLAVEIENKLEGTGAKVEVLNKSKIEALKMGGILAVNKGSIDPPTFTIIEWNPEEAVNKKPVVFVGKGVVYDTGGLNIKTGNYMNDMKSDMSGAAAVAGAMYAIAKAELPIYAIGLIPATDNRPGGNAYANGDIITMYDGSKVEIINTDAEGRMLLADALTYAKKYDPELVIDIATLTGSAMRAIGRYGIVGMQSEASDQFADLAESGMRVFERIVEFPFWEEYREELKSDVADLKHLGDGNGGAISAGKFLAHFTDYPFIHLDIAGPAFLNKKDTYRTKGGVGIGTRLFFDFAMRMAFTT